jgi:hypothetical protein
MATVNSIPKRRWYQYSTRTLFLAMTLVGVGSAWWVHAHFCLQHAADYRLMASRPYFPANFSGPLSIWDEYARDEQIRHKRFQMLGKHYEGLATAYRHAVWFPWERLWIDETPLTDDAQ